MILSLQLDMSIKFGFKLVFRSSTYWCELLTMAWDGYVCQQMQWQSQLLLFRGENNKRNISHLFQIVEGIELQLEMYKFSYPYIVLSSMYLIVRMCLQQQKEGQSERRIYGKFIENLGRSTNMIFYDKVGVNELFGYFLEEFQMNLSNLVDCIRFVGRNMVEVVRVFVFNGGRNRYASGKSYDQLLSIYEGNDELFKGNAKNMVDA